MDISKRKEKREERRKEERPFAGACGIIYSHFFSQRRRERKGRRGRKLRIKE